MIDWSVFEKELYEVCKRSLKDAVGRLAYNPLVLFKMMLLQTWYNLSEMGVEDMVNDKLSPTAFCGLRYG
jgi:IS5 family transposase